MPFVLVLIKQARGSDLMLKTADTGLLVFKLQSEGRFKPHFLLLVTFMVYFTVVLHHCLLLHRQ